MLLITLSITLIPSSFWSQSIRAFPVLFEDSLKIFSGT
jgi:hypothetical protein